MARPSCTKCWHRNLQPPDMLQKLLLYTGHLCSPLPSAAAALLCPSALRWAHLLPILLEYYFFLLLFMFYCEKLGHRFLQFTLAYNEVFHPSLIQCSLLLVCVLFAGASAGLCLSAGLGCANDQQIQ